MVSHAAAGHKQQPAGEGAAPMTCRALAPLQRSRTALLTTFRPGGAAVPTPVSIALDDHHAYFVTAADSGKARRLARDPCVTLAPCTARGEVLGATVSGRARLLEGQERRRMRRLLRPTGPLFASLLLYRLRGRTMRLYEVTPTQPSSR
jgi:PPOX class probable F420-dependent enzyme